MINKRKLENFEDFESHFKLKSKCTNIEQCAKMAYAGDASRPLTGIGKWNEKDEKENFIDSVCTTIAKGIRKLLEQPPHTQDKFDEWHRKLCGEIVKFKYKNEGAKEIKLTYGIAQKWLNMTLKNMLAADLSEDEMKNIKEFLHVPVDASMKSAAMGLMVYVPSEAWSKWNDYDEYLKFQNAVRDKIKNPDKYTCPIDWEAAVWNKIKGI